MEMGTREDLLKKKYPAKLLLFGEHLVLDGAMSLAIPYPKYGASWSQGSSEESLDDFFKYVRSLPFIENEWIDWLTRNNYYLKSDIPRGYGLGSSGALSAAVYEFASASDLLIKEPEDKIRELATIESFFHGKSSGMDAYVSMVDKAILCRNGIPETLEFDLEDLPIHVTLIDSGISRNSKSLINKFVEKREKKHLKGELIRINDTIVQYIASKDNSNLMNDLNRLSEIQFELLDYMIVDSVKPLWKRLLKVDEACMKLCGAGGGGYYLGFGDEKFLIRNKMNTKIQ